MLSHAVIHVTVYKLSATAIGILPCELVRSFHCSSESRNFEVRGVLAEVISAPLRNKVLNAQVHTSSKGCTSLENFLQRKLCR